MFEDLLSSLGTSGYDAAGASAMDWGGAGMGTGFGPSYTPPSVGDYGNLYNLGGQGTANSNFTGLGASGFDPSRYSLGVNTSFAGPSGSSSWWSQIMDKFNQNPVSSLTAMAGLGNQLYQGLNQRGAGQAQPGPGGPQQPQPQPSPPPQQLLPMQQPAPTLDPKAVQALRARQQEQGINTGGAAAPESLAALMGPDSGYNADFIRMILARGY